MQFIKNHFITISGVLIGLAAGYMYWHEVGCLSGTCPITSSPINSSVYGAFMGGLVFNVFQKEKINNMVERIIKNDEGTIIDVRTRAEFQGGHAAGSVNIPVNELTQRIEEVKSLKSPLVLCCASGGRSSMAAHLLKQQGIACHDAGSWINVNYLQSQSASSL